MTAISDEEILEYVAANINSFHESRLAGLKSLKLDRLLSRKNPYLFRSKNVVDAHELVQLMLDAHLSSQEEELFGVFLEGLAVFIAAKTIGGRKSGATGIDLEFDKNGDRYIISIKSGPNWGNSSQINKMKDHFRAASQVLRQGNMTRNVVAVNGCCYGRESRADKGGYFKICGQEFWELISNDRGLYTRIIEPLAHNAKQRNDTFRDNYGPVVNRFVAEFVTRYCVEGAIDWPKLVALSSAATPLIDRPARKRYVNSIRNLQGMHDALQHWNAPELAERILSLDSPEQPLELNSVRGFLIFWSGIESEGTTTLDSTPEGLLHATWNLPDRRSLSITFLDVDKLAIQAADAKGNPENVTRNDQSIKRITATKQLLERAWLTRH